MGLAASQARMLSITARKANCEFQSMQIAQEKLSVTRDMMRASEEYNDSLSQSKLIWDMDGQVSDTFDLTYDLMMSPSAVNGYEPVLVTSQTGQIVLNSKLATAAKSAGLSPNGGKGQMDEATRNKFLEGVGAAGYISASMVNSIENPGRDAGGKAISTYSPAAGLGGEPIDKTTANVMTINNLLNYMDAIKKANNSSDATLIGLMNFDGSNLTTAYGTQASQQTPATLQTSYQKNSNTKYTYLTNNNTLTNVKDFTISELLAQDISITTSKDSVKTEATNFIDQISKAFGNLFIKDNQTTATAALEFAKSQTMALLNSPTNIGNIFGSAQSNASNTAKNSTKYNGIVTAGSASSVSLSNLTRSFLTYYAQALDGYNSGYAINKDASKSVYVTDDLGYYYVTKNVDAINEQNLMIADFYNNMFNNICMNGWTTVGGDVDDKNYLSHAIKNGQLFLSSLNTDGYYYQDHYTKNGHIGEMKDVDAIAKAEAQYNAKKTKLNYKEQLLEVKMKNMDMEISALTTEYDSVKGILGKNVEKTFAMFQNG